MTIRPDPDTAQYTITAVQTESDVLPFMEPPAPVVPKQSPHRRNLRRRRNSGSRRA